MKLSNLGNGLYCVQSGVFLTKNKIWTQITPVVTLRKLNKIKWSQIILPDAQGYFDVKSLAGLTGYNFLGVLNVS